MLRSSRLTEKVATYSLGSDFAALPDDVVDCTKRVVLDTLGCIVLGSTIDAGRIMGSYVREIGGRADASVIGGGLSAPAAYAALANGTSAHADELDASHVSWGHPASVAIPMALAVCETIGADGREFLNAVVLAHDFGGRLVQAAGGRREIQETRHSHSSVLYAVGAAAAAGRLMRLKPLAQHHAMALAMFNISSPAAFMDERKHMTKAMAHGQSAFAAVSGAFLAAGGFEANDNVLEARHGLADFWFSDDAAIDKVTADLGKYFSITDTGFKYYSAGYPIHAPLYNSLKIVQENDVAVAEIRLDHGGNGLARGRHRRLAGHAEHLHPGHAQPGRWYWAGCPLRTRTTLRPSPGRRCGSCAARFASSATPSSTSSPRRSAAPGSASPPQMAASSSARRSSRRDTGTWAARPGRTSRRSSPSSSSRGSAR